MADALLDDLDDLSDVEPEERQTHGNDENGDDEAVGGKSSKMDDDDDDDDKMVDGDDVENGKLPSVTKSQRPLLLDDPALKAHLDAVRAAMQNDEAKPSANNGTNGNTNSNSNNFNDPASKESDQTNQSLILTSNKHLLSLSHELTRTHQTLCTLYHPKFPELEELLVDPLQYRLAIGILQNVMDVTHVNDALNEVLTSNQIITISVAGSTTSGRPLTNEELNEVNEACTYMDQLLEVQKELSTFVESRMEAWAPSICALIGPALAAQLLASTGGLAELSKIPSCNLQLLGRTKSTAASRGGMATQTASYRTHHAGYLMDCELVQSVPNYLKMRAVKAVAGKLALVARSDYVNVESGRRRSAEVGRRFFEELKGKFGKWEEPDKAQVVKALPKPDLTTKKRRGGKRIRRLKERFEETDLMKQANKRAFSVESGEYGDDAMGLTLGLLDSKEGGAMRNTTEKRKMRQANTKASRKRAIQMSSGATNGLASSMVFTPVQGLELVNPDAQRERVRQANAKWFSENSGFKSALPKK